MPMSKKEQQWFEKISLNQLKFPDSDETYPFDNSHLKPIGNTMGRKHPVKPFIHLPSKKKLAIKYIMYAATENLTEEEKNKLKKLQREMETFKTVSSSPDIIDLYGLCTYQNEALICMKLMDCNLRYFYFLWHGSKKLENEAVFPENLIGCIAVSVLDALSYLLQHHIIYRDVKPDNILLNREGQIVICDFGESRFYEIDVSTEDAGTFIYTAPERIISPKKRYDERSDSWSFGITLLEVAYGRLPFVEPLTGKPIKQPNKLLKHIANVDGNELMEKFERLFDKQYSDDLIHFLQLCLKSLDARPSPKTLRKCNFYQIYNKNTLDERKNYVKDYVQNLLEV